MAFESFTSFGALLHKTRLTIAPTSQRSCEAQRVTCERRANVAQLKQGKAGPWFLLRGSRGHLRGGRAARWLLLAARGTLLTSVYGIAGSLLFYWVSKVLLTGVAGAGACSRKVQSLPAHHSPLLHKSSWTAVPLRGAVGCGKRYSGSGL